MKSKGSSLVFESILLDTNAYAAFLNKNEIVGEIIKSTTEIYLPFVVLGELNFGFFKGNKTRENFNLLSKFMSSPRTEILYSDELTFQIYGEIATELSILGKPIQQNDIWIAALAKQHGLVLVSNDNGFANIVGLKLVNF